MDEKLWELYAKTKDRLVKEKLIIEYAPLVKRTVGRLNIQTVDNDDLISYGIFGLIDAIEKFDEGKGVKFETYASLRIKGSIIDHLRKLDWLPRSMRQKKRKLDDVTAKLENELGRAPTDEDIAQELGVSLKEARVLANDSAALTIVSLDDYIEKNSESPYLASETSGYNSPEAGLSQKEIKRMLAEAIENLTERERQVITLYYYEELTIKEISAVLGVSESRVSQLHTSAVARLQNNLEHHKALLLEK